MQELANDLQAMGWRAVDDGFDNIIATLPVVSAPEKYHWIGIFENGSVTIDADATPDVWAALDRIREWQAAL
jgi:hypothetical protein